MGSEMCIRDSANTVRIAETCLRMVDAYGLNEQEKAILLASALLSRVGAIDAFEFKDCMPALTKKGILLGVGSLTMSRVMSAFKRVAATMTKELKKLDHEVVIRILHAIASCDGGCVVPMTKEAILLNAAYRMDAEMVNAVDFIANDVNVSEEFTAYDPIGARRYYTGLRV